ncbi:MAG: MlaD family protein [Candidatus Tectomicrobia bacterium]
MEYFRPNVKVGGFIFMTLILIVIGAITVGNLGSWFATKHTYTVLVHNANLLPHGARVSFAGLPVGHVSAIEMRSAEERAREHPKHYVKLMITVDSTVSLPQDSRVEMKTDGMIGDRFVDILPGSGQPLPPGETLLGFPGGLDGLMAASPNLGGNVQDVLAAVQDLSDASQPHSIPATLANINRLLTDLQPRLAALMTASNGLLQHVQAELVSTSDKAGRALTSVDTIMSENRPGVRRLVSEFNTTLVEARRTVQGTTQLLDASKGEVTKLMQSVHSLVNSVQKNTEAAATSVEKLLTNMNTMVTQNDRNIYAAIENLRDMTAHLEATAELIRANPAVVLWGNRGKNNPSVVPASRQGRLALQDRGRIGRYDRVQ